MDKRFVIVASILIFFISAYFSYDFFDTFGGGAGGRQAQGGVDVDIDEAIPGDTEFTGPRTEECPINGMMLTEGHRNLWETRRPLGIMVENSLDARPQSGLSRTDVVYEFVAEGGITRFLAMYYCRDARFVGPVRSARVYFLSMLQGYGDNPLYGHVGGANTPGPADALGWIQDLGWGGYNDLDQFYVGFPPYYRDYERLQGVSTEHTMYTSTSKLWTYAAEENALTNENEDGDSWDESFEPWEFEDGEPGAGTTTSISYTFWDGRPNYDVNWAYDQEKNSYKRSHGDVPHVDNNTDEQMTSSNVIVAFFDESEANDGYEKGTHLLYDTVGTGEALVFQNGDVIEATWRKPDDTDQIRFFDEGGDEIPMVRGHVWISGVPTGNTVDY